MTRDEILNLPSGKIIDSEIALSRGWRNIFLPRRGWIWVTETGRTIYSYKPSSNRNDYWSTREYILSNEWITLSTKVGRDTKSIEQVEFKAFDWFGPGPTEITYYRASAPTQQLAFCRAYLLLFYRLPD